jgi:malate dehydrogenase (oxaloacetate-decarboxylating)
MDEDALKLENLNELFPKNFTPEQLAKGKTVFLKELSLRAHAFYGGKMVTIPKAGFYGFNWFNVWYTPGVSAVSTAIRDSGEWVVPGVNSSVDLETVKHRDPSFELSNRDNLVAVVSDSTRVLGDGDCSPPGGLGVMEGKAFLMKYLGGCDAVALCIDSRNYNGQPSAARIVEFVKMVEPSFGAINLEDIAQPNCYVVLDNLRELCDIPVWHDDAQGTGCVTLAGLINALKIVDKKIEDVRIILFGAGASNTTIARLILKAGGDPEKLVLFDSKGSLHKDRGDLARDRRFYHKWDLARTTNPQAFQSMADACKDADVLISLSRPGPGVVKPEWVSSMAPDSIVFACANPVPEIYPYEARKAGARIVATGRGDFPNQVNNSLGFPAILKGALIVRAKKITDEMAIAAAHSIADSAYESKTHKVSEDYIVPMMNEAEIFPAEATAVAMQAIKDGVARTILSEEEIYQRAKTDIENSRAMIHHLQESGFVPTPPVSFIEDALKAAVDAVS